MVGHDVRNGDILGEIIGIRSSHVSRLFPVKGDLDHLDRLGSVGLWGELDYQPAVG